MEFLLLFVPASNPYRDRISWPPAVSPGMGQRRDLANLGGAFSCLPWFPLSRPFFFSRYALFWLIHDCIRPRSTGGWFICSRPLCFPPFSYPNSGGRVLDSAWYVWQSRAIANRGLSSFAFSYSPLSPFEFDRSSIGCLLVFFLFFFTIDRKA
jgi:hypothetical protein